MELTINKYKTEFRFYDLDELKELDEDELINYFERLCIYQYYTGQIYLTDEYVDALDSICEYCFNENYLQYLWYYMECNDIFILDEYKFDENRLVKLLYDFDSSKIFKEDEFEDVIYYDQDGLVDLINEILEIPSHLETYMDYDDAIRTCIDQNKYYWAEETALRGWEAIDISWLPL